MSIQYDKWLQIFNTDSKKNIVYILHKMFSGFPLLETFPSLPTRKLKTEFVQ